MGINCLSEMDSAPWKSISELILIRISAKEDVNRPSLNIALLLKNAKYSSKDHCVFVSCWAFLCRFLSGFLVGPTSSRMGMRPAFFVLGRCLVRRKYKLFQLEAPCLHPFFPPVIISFLKPEIYSTGELSFSSFPAPKGITKQ